MKDYRIHLETLRKQAAESALISDLATAPQKRELFATHAAHLDAGHVNRATLSPARIAYSAVTAFPP